MDQFGEMSKTKQVVHAEKSGRERLENGPFPDAAISPVFGSLVLERCDQGASSSRFASVLRSIVRKRVAQFPRTVRVMGWFRPKVSSKMERADIDSYDG